MKHPEQHGTIVIYASFLIAFMLTAMPLPDWATVWRPAWIVLVLIYWSMALPGRVGIGAGWVLGLLVDVLHGTLLGVNALGYALLAYIVIKSYQRIRVYSLIQQSFFYWSNLICLPINCVMDKKLDRNTRYKLVILDAYRFQYVLMAMGFYRSKRHTS